MTMKKTRPSKHFIKRLTEQAEKYTITINPKIPKHEYRPFDKHVYVNAYAPTENCNPLQLVNE